MAAQAVKTFKWPLVLIGIALFSLISLFLFTQSTKKPITHPQTLAEVYLGTPVQLTIPKINVNTIIQEVGITEEGDMETPTNTLDVGWFKLGTLPGKNGSAVIAGHFDGTDGKAGVFSNLDQLKKGDKVHVKDDEGTTLTFIVQESRVYDPGYAEEIFSLNDKAHLNLITCDGAWDGTTKSYSKRLVVLTDIEQEN